MVLTLGGWLLRVSNELPLQTRKYPSPSRVLRSGFQAFAVAPLSAPERHVTPRSVPWARHGEQRCLIWQHAGDGLAPALDSHRSMVVAVAGHAVLLDQINVERSLEGALEDRPEDLTKRSSVNNLFVMKITTLTTANDELSKTLAALADPTRRSILEQLSIGPRSVRELSEPYDMSQPAVSKHIKVLEAAGLVSQETGNRLGRRRLELAPFVKATEWMAAYASIWDTRLKHFARGMEKRSRPGVGANGRRS